ncbi:ATP-binding protein [Paenibacillus sp. NPDC093718]|uniref:ATP-binding protein n=1 Tax=Paenibacillus sp. NPDC093718 TaxID=3390601 RepID=UPI003CFC8C38
MVDESEIRLLLEAREALTNIARHAEATNVSVKTEDMEDNFLMSIQDNGIGFDPDRVIKNARHYRIIGMKERVRIIGGHLLTKTAVEG